jgi:hypothetical protein
METKLKVEVDDACDVAGNQKAVEQKDTTHRCNEESGVLAFDADDVMLRIVLLHQKYSRMRPFGRHDLSTHPSHSDRSSSARIRRIGIPIRSNQSKK